jgi:hypothetical protein
METYTFIEVDGREIQFVDARSFLDNDGLMHVIIELEYLTDNESFSVITNEIDKVNSINNAENKEGNLLSLIWDEIMPEVKEWINDLES